MHFIDEAKIHLKGGKGGNGIIAFHRAKFIEFGGPDGGNGGKGADIILVADPSINTLLDYRHKQHFKGQCGSDGRGDHMTGASGRDIMLPVPVGTQVFSDPDGELLCDLSHAGQQVILARGGRGGVGNAVFKSSTNRAPRHRTLGQPGDELAVRLKLKVLSNVGLVGLPNAGKSTFLAVTTSAHPKIADYPFTTLSPQLGVATIGHDTLVIADIPGLIEGASQGYGLGDRFLRHIERCQVLLHLVDGAAEDVVADYTTVQQELAEYDAMNGGGICDKACIIALNKSDLLEPQEAADRAALLARHSGKEVVICSGATSHNISQVVQLLLVEYRRSQAERMNAANAANVKKDEPFMPVSYGEQDLRQQL